MATVCEKLVLNDRDMLDIEKCIVNELGGENHRCAFFRTIAYIRLRIAALYVPPVASQFACYSDLQVTLTPTDNGPMVAVKRRFNEPLGGMDCTEESVVMMEAMEAGTLSCQKRTRTEGWTRAS